VRAWVKRQPDRAQALLALATGGDDYAVVCAAADGEALIAAAEGDPPDSAVMGAFSTGRGVIVRLNGLVLTPRSLGWRHR